MSPPLSIITAARRLHACRSSVPLCIDAATTSRFRKTKQDDDDDNDQTTQTSTTSIRYYSYNTHSISPLHHFIDYNNITQTSTLNKRSYHTTSRNEILPFLAIGILGITSVYTYRAFEQMDNDWEEYYNKVEEYKLKTGIDPEKEYLTVEKKQKIDEEKKEETRG